jgi:hypothetical protein
MLIAARLNDYRKTRELSDELALEYVTASLMLIDSNYWIRGLGDCLPVWLMDSKPYWRSEYLPSYKQNRLKKDKDGNLLLDENGKPVDYKIPEYNFVYEIFASQEHNKLAMPGFEADDVAGAIVRLWHKQTKRGRFEQIILSTIDSDWAGLVDNDIVWVCQKDFGQRIRGHFENFTWLWGKYGKQTKKDKQLWFPSSDIGKFHSRMIFDWKVAVGDKPDNIKAGCEQWMVDLLFPHPDHNLDRDSEFRDKLSDCLRADRVSRSDEECRDVIRYIDATGIKLPISMLEWKKPEQYFLKNIAMTSCTVV